MANGTSERHERQNGTVVTASAVEMTDEEMQQLEKLESRFSLIRDAVEGVAKHYHGGLFLSGEGGTGKSYTVIEHLRALKADHRVHNSRLTARGLVDKLEEAPAAIHLIEDAETLLDDKKTFGVLRSALWANGHTKKRPQPRPITWTAYKTRIDFIFTGGLIIISNTNLVDAVPEVRAIRTRIGVLSLDVTQAETLALMKKICMDGYKYGDDYLPPAKCHEVREYVVSKLSDLKRSLDLRLMINGFRDYLQWQSGDSVNDWQALIDGRISGQVLYRTRDEKNLTKKQQAMEIYAMTLTNDEKLKLWAERTGLSQAAYYRALGR